MGIKKHKLVDQVGNYTSNLEISYDQSGMWLEMGGNSILISKSKMYEVAADMVYYFTHFKEDEEELQTWLENMLDYTRE